MSQGRLFGKTAIVTGGASGMGASQVEWFVREGARVLIADVDVNKGSELASKFKQSAWFCRLDVTSEEAWTEAVNEAETHFEGPVTILVNNAGVLRDGSVETTTLADYRFSTEILQTGVFLGIKAVAASMRRAGGGSIVNISSTAGLVGNPNTFAYVAAKWAVRGMTKAAALDLAPAGIRVNSVHPGNTNTPMIEGKTGKEYSVDEIPLRRNATVDEISTLVVYLASDEASYTTGAEHVIDGGFTAM
ncbi:SDR family oxidoreductase [Burkholderia sp. Ac-20344]|uniref:SDR family oxidoreductase n=1 Tax=Burkholderia sp. Ac-20344 TaxID=2703890 RepID=UPI00197C9494|nr:SDR family oxidoreductase [Burkholderia sp. Ac-20344]MBN3836723.1 SDR family oxidoreductase [Burkholderia sp. Ac-20344]